MSLLFEAAVRTRTKNTALSAEGLSWMEGLHRRERTTKTKKSCFLTQESHGRMESLQMYAGNLEMQSSKTTEKSDGGIRIPKNAIIYRRNYLQSLKINPPSYRRHRQELFQDDPTVITQRPGNEISCTYIGLPRSINSAAMTSITGFFSQAPSESLPAVQYTNAENYI